MSYLGPHDGHGYYTAPALGASYLAAGRSEPTSAWQRGQIYVVVTGVGVPFRTLLAKGCANLIVPIYKLSNHRMQTQKALSLGSGNRVVIGNQEGLRVAGKQCLTMVLALPLSAW